MALLSILSTVAHIAGREPVLLQMSSPEVQAETPASVGGEYPSKCKSPAVWSATCLTFSKAVNNACYKASRQPPESPKSRTGSKPSQRTMGAQQRRSATGLPRAPETLDSGLYIQSDKVLIKVGCLQLWVELHADAMESR